MYKPSSTDTPREVPFDETDDSPVVENYYDDSVDKLFSHFKKDEKTAILIDGANMYSTTRDMKFTVDHRRFRELFNHYTDIESIYYFTALNQNSDANFGMKATKSTVDWMSYYGGFRVIHKPTKEIAQKDGSRITKGNMDVEITVYALEYCQDAKHIVLVSGDGDFRFLVEALQRKGKIVTIISSAEEDSKSLADELWRQSDYLIDFSKIKHLIEKQRRDYQ